MRRFGILALALAAGACSSAPAEKPRPDEAPVAARPAPLVYPRTRTVDHVDTYHGTAVKDPYRWLEDLDGQETAAWVKAQNELTFGYLEKIPARARIRERLEQLWSFERWSVPEKAGDRFFYARNDGLQNQAVIYVADSLAKEPRVLLDPNTLSKDGTVAVGGTVPSEDGKLFAYGVQTAGSDWTEWRFRDVESGKDLADTLRWVKFSGVSWTRDGTGLYYSRYDEPRPGEPMGGTNYFQKLFFHRIGTPQAEDRLVYESKEHKERRFGGRVTEDGRWLVVSIGKGTAPKNAVAVKDLDAKDAPFRDLVTGFENGYGFLGNEGNAFYFRSDLDAPRGCILTFDVATGERKTIVAQAQQAIQSASLVGDRLLVSYLEDARTRVKVFDLEGKPLGDVELPGLGSAGGFGGRRSDRETYYSFTNATTPATVYRWDLTTGKSSVVFKPKLAFDPAEYESKQVFVASKDGTKVPLTISCRRGTAREGANPTYLYGYGGFNASMTPRFDPSALVWMEMGGVHAVANLRGGGEYGEEWHQAGTKLRKQNVFDDFIACAEWLVANKWTSPAKLSIAGGSNGGLLVGACLVQRPDLFGAALPDVGVLDMLRFHKFTIGWAWVDDYGSSDDPEQFKALLAYSPYHNVKPAKYPAVLVTTADHDDRVVPLHSFKFAAALQAAQEGPAPVLARVEVRAGHGAGKPTKKIIDARADTFAFLVRALGME